MDKKWNLQDIKPAGSSRRPMKRSTQGGEVPVRTNRERSSREEYSEEDTSGTMSIPITNGKKKKKKSKLLIALLIFGVFASAAVASLLSSGAELTVYPRTNEPNVNATFTGYAEAPAGELAYEVMTLEASGERQVTASGQQEVSELAEGTIEVFKSTPGTQRLIKNTRFSDSSGKIFRITESVVVPGAIGEEPGRIQANVFADESGDAHNLAAGTRFTVPGLESDAALFNAIYAENDVAFSGGFNGQKFIIDQEQLATAKQALQMELRDALLERLPGEQPSGFVAFISGVAFTYESLPSVAYGDNLATIKEKALLQIPLFSEIEFASYLAAATISDYDGQEMRIEDSSVLTFAYQNATTSSSNIANEESLSFQLAGRPLLVAQYDAGKLSTDLLGAPKQSLITILSAYPAIERAEAVIRPFWQRTFPTNINQIDIIEVLE